MADSELPAAGWYPDSDAPDHQVRLWDGFRWTASRLPRYQAELRLSDTGWIEINEQAVRVRSLGNPPIELRIGRTVLAVMREPGLGSPGKLGLGTRDGYQRVFDFKKAQAPQVQAFVRTFDLLRLRDMAAEFVSAATDFLGYEALEVDGGRYFESGERRFLHLRDCPLVEAVGISPLRPYPTALDTGSIEITSQRVLFVGGAQTREWRFERLAAIQHNDGRISWTMLPVPEWPINSGFAYGGESATFIRFYLGLALAEFHGRRPQYLQEVLAAWGPVVEGKNPLGAP